MIREALTVSMISCLFCKRMVQSILGKMSIFHKARLCVYLTVFSRLLCTLRIFHKSINTGLPWWCSVWESTYQCRRHGFEPCSGKIPHAAEQLSWCTTTSESALSSPRATTTEARTPRARVPQQEKPVHCNKEQPPLSATRESPCAATNTQLSHK